MCHLFHALFRYNISINFKVINLIKINTKPANLPSASHKFIYYYIYIPQQFLFMSSLEKETQEIMAAIEILVNTKASLEKIEFSERLKS